MKKFKVKSNLKHDGKFYKKNDLVALEEETAKRLIKDGIVVGLKEEIEDDESEAPQPAVNTVKREGGEVSGEQTVEEGKVEGPQPGDEVNDGEDAGESGDAGSGADGSEDDGENL